MAAVGTIYFGLLNMRFVFHVVYMVYRHLLLQRAYVRDWTRIHHYHHLSSKLCVWGYRTLYRKERPSKESSGNEACELCISHGAGA
jgi:hypothetical protein